MKNVVVYHNEALAFTSKKEFYNQLVDIIASGKLDKVLYTGAVCSRIKLFFNKNKQAIQDINNIIAAGYTYIIIFYNQKDRIK